MRHSVFLFISIFFLAGIISASDSKIDLDVFPNGFYDGDPLPEKTAYLTFDDGPSDWTGIILDTLEKEGIHATFFICGNWQTETNIEQNAFKAYRKTLIRMVQDGNVVGNHTFDHDDLALLKPDKIAWELDINESQYFKALGTNAKPMTLVRPPFGSPWYDQNPKRLYRKVGTVVRKRALVVMWNKHFNSTDSNGWVKGEWYEKSRKTDFTTPEFLEKENRMLSRMVERADGRGLVMLCHDTHPTSVLMLPKLIESLKEKGYTFATIEDYVKWRWGKSSAEMVKEE